MPGFHQRFVGLAELPRSIPQFDVDESFQLGQHDIDEVRYQFKASRLGAALQLVVIKAAGRSPKKLTGIPRTLLRSLFVSLKLNVTAILTAFDIADKAVAKSRAMAERHEVVERFQVRIADVDGYDWPIDALDGVASIFVRFADPPLLERMFPRITAALKPVGTLTLRCCRATRRSRSVVAPVDPSRHRTCIPKRFIASRSPTWNSSRCGHTRMTSTRVSVTQGVRR